VNTSPLIGIFWLYKGQVLAQATSLEAGVDSPESIDSPFDHVRIWPNFQAKHQELRHLEYEEVPRGRVLFLKRGKRFMVYLDKKLLRQRRRIQQTFHLPATRTSFTTDPHYLTDSKSGRQIFDD
jgi:hypothetical protein